MMFKFLNRTILLHTNMHAKIESTLLYLWIKIGHRQVQRKLRKKLINNPVKTELTYVVKLNGGVSWLTPFHTSGS